MEQRQLVWFVLIATTVILLSGCVPGDGTHRPAGFFWGIWHGWLASISLVVEIFKPNIRIYEVANSGWWYDFGYYMAIISGFGGLSLVRKRKRSKKG